MKGWKTTVLITGITALLLTGLIATVTRANSPGPESGPDAVQEGSPWYYGGGTMGQGTTGGYGGMMGGGVMGGGMMGQGTTGGYGGMMGGGMMGGGTMGQGTTGGYGGMMGQGYGLFGRGEPVPADEARAAVESYLAALGNNDLEVADVMVFTNHSYAQVIERSTGIGAFEVLVDHANLQVSPEMGPNMIWNLKYSPMAGTGGTGSGICHETGNGATDGLSGPQEAQTEMPIGAEQAVEAAQRHLDAYLPGTQADEHADAFYGYYTIHTLKYGVTTGMLSVNGYTGQVFYHSWHSELVEMAE